MEANGSNAGFGGTDFSLCAFPPVRKPKSQAEQVAEICVSSPSGVKTPEENADFMSCLKARPTKLKTFSATCEACATRPRRNARIRIRRKIPLLSVAGFVEAARCLGGQFLSGTYLLVGYLIPGKTGDPSADRKSVV